MDASLPVVIVGGGPSGLLLAQLLARYCVPCVVLEAQTPRSRFAHPQAHFLNTRTMEILKHCCGSAETKNTNDPDYTNVYERVKEAMPPVQHWSCFRFGASMTAEPMAVVRHPVNRPLQSSTNANGVLVPLASEGKSETESDDKPAELATDLSPCTVGHLAQHTFGQIIADASTTMASHCSNDVTNTSNKPYLPPQILYDTRVERVQVEDDGRLTVVATTAMDPVRTNSVSSSRRTIKLSSRLVVAADGAHSPIRHQFGIECRGREGLQHLLNMHVQLSDEDARRLHHHYEKDENVRVVEDNDSDANYAMLYSVYTSHCVAMVVCHKLGDYVVQIPYFPPYQTPKDFGPDRWQVLMEAIFGFAPAQMSVKSVKPWTMSSLLADDYFVPILDKTNACAGIASVDSCTSAVVLVGDAAHVFPPAGGFGMNTGLQDVHNLAWKIAAATHQTTTASNDEISVQQGNLLPCLEAYQRERRPVAMNNAALSVRNYQRILDLHSKSLYLNHQHPELLQSVLDNIPLPLKTKQIMFKSLLQAALAPMAWLESTHRQNMNPYSKHVSSNLRDILDKGAGLPLLFPSHELGFRYASGVSPTADEANPNSTDNDTTWTETHGLTVGNLMPHTPVKVVSGCSSFPHLQFLEYGCGMHDIISTTDLSAQMRRTYLPSFTLLYVDMSSRTEGNHRQDWMDSMNDRRLQLESLCLVLSRDLLGLPVEVAILGLGDQHGAEEFCALPQRQDLTVSRKGGPTEILYLEMLQRESAKLSLDSDAVGESSVVLLIRPDGHISGKVAVKSNGVSQNDMHDAVGELCSVCGLR